MSSSLSLRIRHLGFLQIFVAACFLTPLDTPNGVFAIQLRSVWSQDQCQQGICTGIKIGRNDDVILPHMPTTRQITLTFMNSTIAKIPPLMFVRFRDLQMLRMENCSIESFVPNQFQGAKSLRSLYLGHNRLRNVPKHNFQGAHNLNVLHLDHNTIRTLHNASFDALKELTELSLAANELKDVPVDVFAAMPKLQDLNLAGNRLEGFRRGIFDRNLPLKRINLARNHFVAFEAELFKKQKHIALLDLSDNILPELVLNLTAHVTNINANNCDLRRVKVYGVVQEMELRNNSLREFPYVQYGGNMSSLDVSHNPLGSLRDSPLKRFTQLTRLNLSATSLHDLPEHIFEKQSKLTLLDISANSLFSLRPLVFDYLQRLQYFYFQQNNWNCDFLQLLMSTFVKRRDIAFMEDSVAPEFVDDYIDGIACWYESNKPTKKCDGDGYTDAALELAVVRNDIKAFTEVVEKKFVKVFRMLEELKMRL